MEVSPTHAVTIVLEPDPTQEDPFTGWEALISLLELRKRIVTYSSIRDEYSNITTYLIDYLCSCTFRLLGQWLPVCEVREVRYCLPATEMKHHTYAEVQVGLMIVRELRCIPIFNWVLSDPRTNLGESERLM